MWGDHGVIFGWLSIEGNPVNIGVKIGEYHMEDAPWLQEIRWSSLMELDSSSRRGSQPRPLPIWRTNGELIETGDMNTSGCEILWSSRLYGEGWGGDLESTDDMNFIVARWTTWDHIDGEFIPYLIKMGVLHREGREGPNTNVAVVVRHSPVVEFISGLSFVD